MGLKPRPKFLVGDRVKVPYGPYDLDAEIIEDRGCVGAGGRRLYRVRVSAGAYTWTTEWPEERMRKSNQHRGVAL